MAVDISAMTVLEVKSNRPTIRSCFAFYRANHFNFCGRLLCSTECSRTGPGVPGGVSGARPRVSGWRRARSHAGLKDYHEILVYDLTNLYRRVDRPGCIPSEAFGRRRPVSSASIGAVSDEHRRRLAAAGGGVRRAGHAGSPNGSDPSRTPTWALGARGATGACARSLRGKLTRTGSRGPSARPG